jgi:membrane protease YdiL (CAAX protease family)
MINTSKNRRKLFYILSATLITIITLYLIDQVLQVNYISKVIVKLVVFSLFPMIYIKVTKDNFIKNSFSDKKLFSIKLSHILGVLIFFVILITFYFTKKYINIDVLIYEFEVKYKINKSNILYYGIYLSLVNSLLEEFFFRGFIFLNLKNIGMRKSDIFLVLPCLHYITLAIFKIGLTGVYLF